MSQLREEYSSFIGIAISIAGNILISIALNVQRYAHLRLEHDQLNRHYIQRNYGTQQDIADERQRLNLSSTAQPTPPSPREDVRKLVHTHGDASPNEAGSDDDDGPPPRKTYLKSAYWWCGIFLMTVGETGNFLAYGFAPASIVSPLGVVALVSNCIIAPCLLKERFRQRDFWGIVIAIAGTVTIVLSAKTSTVKMGPDDIWQAITRWEFLTYVGITVLAIAVLAWASERYGDRSILIDLGLVSLFGGYTALSTKGVASLLSDSLWRTLTYPVAYLLVFILVATALLQIRHVNRALQRFDSTQVIPIQFVLFTISVIVGSAILYRDFESATPDRIGKFIGGCIMTFLGVYLITSKRGRRQEFRAQHHDGEENIIGLVDDEAYHDVDTLGGGDGPATSYTSPTYSDRAPHTQTQSDATTTPTPKSPTRKGLARPGLGESSISSPLPSQDGLRQPESPSRHPGSGRRSSLSRRSIARLAPGEFTSPLSSSLSAVIAEQRRRSTRPRSEQSGTGLDSPFATPRSSRHMRGSVATAELPPAIDDGDEQPAQASVDDELPGSSGKHDRPVGRSLRSFFGRKKTGEGQRNSAA